MKSALHHTLGLIRVAVIVGLALLLLDLAFGGKVFGGVGEANLDLLSWGVQTLAAHRLGAGLAALGLLAVEALYWGTRPDQGRRRKNLVIRQPSGEVTISLRTLREELARLADRSEDVVALEAEVLPTRKGLDLELNVSLGSRCSVPDVSRLLQEQAQQWIAEHMGEARVGQVRVNVRELIREPTTPEFAAKPTTVEVPAKPATPAPPPTDEPETPRSQAEPAPDTIPAGEEPAPERESEP